MTRWTGIGALVLGLVLLVTVGARAQAPADAAARPQTPAAKPADKINKLNKLDKVDASRKADKAGIDKAAKLNRKATAKTALRSAKSASRKQFVTADALPAAVADTIRTEQPGATVRKAVRLTKGSETWYQVALADGKRGKARLVIGADGRLLTSKTHK
jgi:hypothetical protein